MSPELQVTKATVSDKRTKNGIRHIATLRIHGKTFRTFLSQDQKANLAKANNTVSYGPAKIMKTKRGANMMKVEVLFPQAKSRYVAQFVKK